MFAIGIACILFGYAFIYAGMSKFLKFPPANNPVSFMEALGVGVTVSKKGTKGGKAA